MPDAPVRVNLCASALPPGAQYVAISYAWPEDVSKSRIFMDCASGCVEFVTSTQVEGVLRRLRQPSTAIFVWVDSICIDQANSQERSFQVGKMRTIYENASSVFVWLGEPKAVPLIDITHTYGALCAIMEQDGHAVW